MPLPVGSDVHRGTPAILMPVDAKTVRAVLASAHMTTIATAAGPIALGAGPVRITLAAPGGGTLASRLGELAPGQRLYLVLKNHCATEQPGVLFHLYLHLPPHAKPRQDDPHYVGSLNFFNAVKPDCAEATSAPFRSYDITALAQRLRSQNLLSDPTTVTILAMEPPATGARATIGRVELMAQ